MSNEREYDLFDPPPAMYSDEELEAWGALYCKLELHSRGRLPFVQFMALPLARRRACLRAALGGFNSPPPEGCPKGRGGGGIGPTRDSRATPAGGVSEQITPAAGAGALHAR